MTRGAKISIVSAITALGLTFAATVSASRGVKGGSLTSEAVADAIDAHTATTAARARVFFGHQSVGANIIQAIPFVYDAKGLPSPEIVEVLPDSSTSLPGGGFFAHSFIGENGDPEGKLDTFDSMLRSGLGDEVSVAMMKFCYVDIDASTDVAALFGKYQATFAALERDFPNVTFLYLTTPLTTDGGVKGRLKSLIGAGNPSAADNAARERLNTLIRRSYDSDHVFDLAALESTAPNGTTLSGSYDGEVYHTLYEGYAVDEGHLTSTFARLAASKLLTLIANT
jgi:hypothetical protein